MILNFNNFPYCIKNRIFRFWEFTLLELLIVIAVISILASLLLPALGMAKQRVRSIACLGNLKQCGLSISLYAVDCNEYVPPEYDSYGDNKTWDRKLYDWDYIKKRDITKCPSYPPATSTSWGRCYGMVYTSGSWVRKMGASYKSTKLILLADTKKSNQDTQYYRFFYDEVSTAYDKVHTRHFGAANILFADIHAGPYAPLKLQEVGWPSSYRVSYYIDANGIHR